jgi:hypothetical protein
MAVPATTYQSADRNSGMHPQPVQAKPLAKDWLGASLSFFVQIQSPNFKLTLESFHQEMENLYTCVKTLATREFVELKEPKRRKELITLLFYSIIAHKGHDRVTLVILSQFFKCLTSAKTPGIIEGEDAFLRNRVVPLQLRNVNPETAKLCQNALVIDWLADIQTVIMVPEERKELQEIWVLVPDHVIEKLTPARIQIGKELFAEALKGNFTRSDCLAFIEILKGNSDIKPLHPDSVEDFRKKYQELIDQACEPDHSKKYSKAYTDLLIFGLRILAKKLPE